MLIYELGAALWRFFYCPKSVLGDKDWLEKACVVADDTWPGVTRLAVSTPIPPNPVLWLDKFQFVADKHQRFLYNAALRL